jgi:hypothetical protein
VLPSERIALVREESITTTRWVTSSGATYDTRAEAERAELAAVIEAALTAQRSRIFDDYYERGTVAEKLAEAAPILAPIFADYYAHQKARP